MGYYVVIPAPIRHHEDLADGAKLLYGDIAGLSKKEGYCYASNAKLSEIARVSDRQITRYLRALAKHGFIRWEDQRNGRKIFITIDNPPDNNGGSTRQKRREHPTNMAEGPDKSGGSAPDKNGGYTNTEYTITETKTDTHAPAKRARVTSAQVESVYDLYPRKVGKQAALKAIEKTIRTVSKREDIDGVGGAVEFLQERMRLFASSAKGQAGKYCPYPATFFNQGRYDDDPAEWERADKEQGAGLLTYQEMLHAGGPSGFEAVKQPGREKPLWKRT